MKYQHLALVLILALVVCDATTKTKKPRKFRRIIKTSVPVVDPEVNELTNDDDVIKMLEKDEEYEKAFDADRAKQDVEIPPEEITDNRVPIIDACAIAHCGPGRVCELDLNGEAQCVCISACPIETESRRKVCSNHNETWGSDCAVYQQRCWCKTGDERCKGEEYNHVHIEYYGECRDMPVCTEGEMADFPRRMRDWLFNIMRDLADRQELPAYYLKMEREAETNLTKRWANAAVWKWCDLDQPSGDRSVSRHELFPIRAPLMALEHCIAPFLNKCDADNDHLITLKEWVNCLEIDEEEIDDRCEELDDKANAVV